MADVEEGELLGVGEDVAVGFQGIGEVGLVDCVDVGGEGGGVVGGGEEAGAEEVDDFAGAVEVAGKDGEAGGEAFYDGEAEAFEERGLDEEVVVLEVGFDPVAVFLSEEGDVVLEVELGGEGLEFGEGGAGADEVEVDGEVGVLFEEEVEGLDGNGLAFLGGVEAADLDDEEGFGGGVEGVGGAGLVVGEVYAVVDYLGVDSCALLDFFLHGFGDGEEFSVLFEKQGWDKGGVEGEAGFVLPADEEGEDGVFVAVDNVGR